MINAALAISGIMQLKSPPDKPRTYSMTFNGLNTTEFGIRMLVMNASITGL